MAPCVTCQEHAVLQDSDEDLQQLLFQWHFGILGTFPLQDSKHPNAKHQGSFLCSKWGRPPPPANFAPPPAGPVDIAIHVPLRQLCILRAVARERPEATTKEETD